MTSSGQEWQFLHCQLKSSCQEWQFHIATDMLVIKNESYIWLLTI